jgi:ligand-binding sensor domain-containing protein/signal transduction histidine kinase
MWSLRAAVPRVSSALASALLVCLPAACLEAAPAWHTVGVWRQPQGLPQNSVRTILQTRDGFLWLGTSGGLSRFDGVRFTTFDDREKSQLRENEIWALLEARDGSLWIGTYGGGISRLKDGRFTVYTAADGLVNDFVAALAEDAEGALWIGTDNGLSRFKDGLFTSYAEDDGLGHLKIRALHADTDGTLWVGAIDGALVRMRGGWVDIGAPGLPPLKAEVRSFCRARDGAFWISTAAGLWRLKDGRAQRYTTEHGLASNVVHEIYEDPQGNLWAATDNGLSQYRDGRFVLNRIMYALPHREQLTAVLGDREGSLWVGSWSQGLAHLRQGPFMNWASRDGLAGDYVSSVLQGRDGRIWVGTNKGLSVFEDGELTTQALASRPSLNVTTLAEDLQGNLLVGTQTGVYLVRIAGCATCPAPAPILLPKAANIYARVIHVDGKGVIWIGTDAGGLVRYDGPARTTYTKQDGLGDDAVRAIVDDPEGGLWIGTKGGGLNRLREGRFENFMPKDGLPDENVHAFFRDADGTLWFSTRQGLGRLKDGQFRTVTMADGLYSNFVYSFVDDGRGYLWMSCNKGIFRVAKRELNEKADGRRATVTSVAYGVEHGIGIVGTVGHHPGAYRARNGRIWLATADGVAVIDPRGLPKNEVEPPVHIEELTVDQRRVPMTGSIRLPPGRGDLTFRYTALSFLAPEKVRFRYKLEGYDAEWRDVQGERVAAYTNIPPGPYQFRVIACNNDGKWNETGASLYVDLAPHFHQTRWFVALCGLAIVLAGVGVHLLRVRAMAGQKLRLEALVGERTQELEAATHMLDGVNRDLEQRVADGIGALRESERMAAYGQLVAGVAHEVRHPVFALQVASHVLRDRLAGDPTARAHLRTLESETNRLSALMSDLLDFARPPELRLALASAVEVCAEAVDVFRTEGHSDVHVDVEVEPGLPRLPMDRFRLVHAVLNLMRNAVSHAGGLTRIRLIARRPPEDSGFGLRISVSDDGAGIDAQLLDRIFEPFVTGGKGTGLGLSIARRVVTAHGGVVSVESERGRGTVFHLDLPVLTAPAAVVSR